MTAPVMEATGLRKRAGGKLLDAIQHARGHVTANASLGTLILLGPLAAISYNRLHVQVSTMTLGARMSMVGHSPSIPENR